MFYGSRQDRVSNSGGIGRKIDSGLFQDSFRGFYQDLCRAGFMFHDPGGILSGFLVP